MSIHFKHNSNIRETSGILAGVGGKVREVKEVYAGKNGKPVLVWRGRAKYAAIADSYAGLNGTPGVYWSNDLQNWNPGSGAYTGKLPANSQYAVYYNHVAYGDGKYICVGRFGYSYYSIDGKSWVPMSGEVSVGSSGSSFDGIAYGAGKFVAICSTGQSYYSVDGASWAKGYKFPAAGRLQFENGQFFMATGANDDSIYRSADGVSWEKAACSFIIRSAIIKYTGDKFIAMNTSSYNSSCGTSTDGVNWQFPDISGISVSDGFIPRGITCGDGKLLAYGTTNYSKSIYGSADGLSWSLLTSEHGDFHDVKFLGSRFIGLKLGLYISADGAAWSKMPGTDGLRITELCAGK